MVLVLIAAAAVSLLLGELLDTAVIVAIVVANAGLGAFQEGRAEQAARALESLLAPAATVVRPGAAPQRADAAELVPGDVVLLVAGDSVPADGRLLEAVRLEIDEAAMTGESVPAAKRADPPDSAPATLAERATMAYSGTMVTRGEGRLLVTATGPRTELGRIARAAGGSRPATPLESRLERLASLLFRAAIAICILLAGLSVAHGASLGEGILVGASLAVAAVPEGLPAVVTITLALGMRRLAGRGAIVRRLRAVETLGSASVICTDKTGTLTTGTMTVERLGPAVEEGGEEAERSLLEAALLASSDAEDPEEEAIVAAAAAREIDQAAALEGRKRVGGEPFDAERKRMSVVLASEDGARTSYVKGAPEILAARLADRRLADALEARARAWAGEGARVLLVARRERLAAGDDPESELEALGLIGIVDPIRPGVPASVAAARRAGIRTLMISGDHPGTAGAVARRCGIGADPGRPGVLTGAELEAMSDEELGRRIEAIDVVARAVPEHKSRVVDALQERAAVVAMTGDGVNDAPALRAADVGVAVGPGATDVARAAADIVLTGNDYSTIVAAVEGGRRIYDNIVRFITFLLAANAGEVLLFALAVLPGLGAPLTIVQILIVNLLTDGMPAVALGVDPADRRTMTRPPRPRSEGILRPRAAQLAVGGLATGGSAFAAFLIGSAESHVLGQTMAFTTVLFAQLGYVYAVRSDDWLVRAGRNPLLDLAVGGSALFAALALFVTPLAEALALVPMSPGLLAAALGLATIPLVATELLKWALRGRRRGV